LRVIILYVKTKSLFELIKAAYIHLLKLLPELEWRVPVLIQAIIPRDSFENLQVAANQPVTTLFINVFLIGMLLVVNSELAAATLLLAVRVDADVLEDSHVPALPAQANHVLR